MNATKRPPVDGTSSSSASAQPTSEADQLIPAVLERNPGWSPADFEKYEAAKESGLVTPGGVE